MASGLWIITGAHVLRACYLRSVLFSWVLGPRVEAIPKFCLHMVLKRSSESHSCISHRLTVFTSVTVVGKPLDVQVGWKIRLLLKPPYLG